MRLLLTADLHYRLHWFRWLIERAPSFDLICIPGDLLDMFKSATRLEQAREVRTLIRELADNVPVAVCSGNHDMLTDSSHTIGRRSTNGSLILEATKTSSPMVQRESWRT